MMRIDIDARFLTHPQPGGFKTYTENLIETLAYLDCENQYLLFVDRSPPEEGLINQNNFSYQVVKGAFPVIGMPYREQIKLRQKIAQDKPDLIHFLCNTAPVKLNRKYVVTLHDTIQLTNPINFSIGRNLAANKRWAILAYSKWAILKTAQNAVKIITVSNYEKSLIEKYAGVPEGNISVIHLAPNPIYKAAGQELRNTWRAEIMRDYGLHEPYIMGVGYEPRKNMPLLIDAFAYLAHLYPDMKLVVIAAEARSRAAFTQYADNLPLGNRVKILAAIPPTEMVKLYNLAEVFVFPSERESFGLPPLEAVACGTPTVAMKSTSIPEVLEDGAFWVEGKDVIIWAGAIQRVVEDENLRAELIKRGLQRSATLTWSKCAQETLRVYQSLAKDHPTETSTKSQ